MEEVRSEESLEDFVRRHKTRNQRLEARFKEMMALAMKCNVAYVIVTRNQLSPGEVEYLRGIPGLTVTDRKLPVSKGWKISW
jgi:hypothetical protein